MDYSKFSDEDFDTKSWINAAFKVHKEGSLEQYAATLVMKLQMFMQEVSNVLEDSCQQVVTNLPRASKELEALGQEVSLLHEQMKMVKYDIEKVEHETANSMQTLLELDTVKGRIKLASDALREADNWTILSSDVDDVFGSQDVAAIAKKIVGMQQSLHILSEVPDHADRCQYLEVLKNRLEATCSPSIVAAFSNQSLESAQKFARIFSDIERLPQLCKYYHNCHKSKLQEFWKDLHFGGEPSEQDVKKMLDSLYDHLLTVWQAQVKWCEQVFPDPASMVCDLLSDSLKNLEPTPHSVIDACIKLSPTPLEMLITFKSTTDNFVAFLEKAMSPLQLASCKMMNLKRLYIAIYSPYKPFVIKFPVQERNALQNFLDQVKFDHEDFMESTTLLEQSVSPVFNAASESLKRCVKLTNGVSFVPYLEVLKEYLGSYMKELRRVLTNIFEKCSSDPVSLDDNEWTHFQNSLRAIQTCGDLVLHLDELDQSFISYMITSCTECSPRKTGDESLDSLESKKLAYLDSASFFLDTEEERREVEDLVSALKGGDTVSVLDSVKREAHDLCALVHKFSFDIVFNPLKHYLHVVSGLQVWKSENVGSALTSDLPNFSLVPQEYITNVGQYLMTLPQQLEPFTGESSLTMQIAMKYGQLPFTNTTGELPEHMAELWLESLARGSLHTYCEQILLIPELTPTSSKQLLIDIGYITNVLDDLGLRPTESIRNISSLLEATEDFHKVAENCPQRLSSAIGYMRGFIKK